MIDFHWPADIVIGLANNTQNGYNNPQIGYRDLNMAKQAGGLASALFSQVQLRVLSLFFRQPSRSYQVTQAIKLVGSGRGAVQREMEKLTRAGILSVSISEGRKLYQANRQSPIFEEIHGLILKTAGLLDPLRTALKLFAPKIKAAFVYGSVAKGTDTAKSDIDLMIIGYEIGYSDIYAALQKAEKKLLRPINPHLLTPDEWRQKVVDKSHFVSNVAQQPKLFIFGTENELQGIGQSR